VQEQTNKQVWAASLLCDTMTTGTLLCVAHDSKLPFDHLLPAR